MQALPHVYTVRACAASTGKLRVGADHLPSLEVAPPREFDGPGDQWSPEELLMAAVSNCLILSFKTIAAIAKLDWLSIECEARGELDKVGRKMQFTTVTMSASLVVPSPDLVDKATKLLNKAEEICIISNSLSAQSHFTCAVVPQ